MGDFYDAQSKSASLHYHLVTSERILMVITDFAVDSREQIYSNKGPEEARLEKLMSRAPPMGRHSWR